MALRNQPYIPLYVQDFMTDEKLMECSAETTGVYIRLMCIFHKQKDYGVLLLNQSSEQAPTCLDFADKLVKYMPYKVETIEHSLSELLLNDVIQQDGCKLLQKRMIKDNDISLKRASAGSTGGKKTQLAKAKVQASVEANTEDETEDECEVETEAIKPNKIPPCPHSAIIDLYHEKLPMLPKVGMRTDQNDKRVYNWKGKRMAHLRDRWADNKGMQALERWGEYFDFVAGLPFLLGKNDRGWKADLAWIVNPTNYEKITEKGGDIYSGR